MPEGRSKLHERDAQTKRYGQNRCRWKGCDPSERQCAENCRYHRVRHHEAAYQFVTSPNWPEWAVERSPSTVTVPVELAYDDLSARRGCSRRCRCRRRPRGRAVAARPNLRRLPSCRFRRSSRGCRQRLGGEKRCG